MAFVVNANLFLISKISKLGCGITYVRLKSSHEFVVFFFRGHVIGSNNHINSVPMLKNLISHLWSLTLRTCNGLALAQSSDFVRKVP